MLEIEAQISGFRLHTHHRIPWNTSRFCENIYKKKTQKLVTCSGYLEVSQFLEFGASLA